MAPAHTPPASERTENPGIPQQTEHPHYRNNRPRLRTRGQQRLATNRNTTEGPAMFGYETANEEIQARIETLRRSAVKARTEAEHLAEQSAANHAAAQHNDRVADEYEAVLAQATATN